MPAWITRAFEGSLEDIEAARAALQAALEAGTYTAHQIPWEGVRPAFGGLPGPPTHKDSATRTFGFYVASGVEYEVPPGCIEVNDYITAIVMGVGGWQPPLQSSPSPEGEI